MMTTSHGDWTTDVFGATGCLAPICCFLIQRVQEPVVMLWINERGAEEGMQRALVKPRSMEPRSFVVWRVD